MPFVKIVTAWYHLQAHTLRGIERPKAKGFTLEALVAQCHDPDASSYVEAFVTFLTNLWDACGADLTRGVFPSVPDFGRDDEQKALRMTATEARAFGAIVEGSLTMARAAYGTEGVAASAAAWREVFGPKFPVQAATTVSASKAVAKTQSESDWEDDDEADVELAHIDLPAPTRLGTLRIAAGLASS